MDGLTVALTPGLEEHRDACAKAGEATGAWMGLVCGARSHGGWREEPRDPAPLRRRAGNPAEEFGPLV